MNKKWLFVLAPPAVVLFVYAFGELVMHLWNWLLPPLFGWHVITFWQGLGLLLLSRILVGSWGGGGDRKHGKGPGRRGWQRMTPEERAEMRQNMRERWCGHGPVEGETGGVA
jgi:hypothetical protein